MWILYYFVYLYGTLSAKMWSISWVFQNNFLSIKYMNTLVMGQHMYSIVINFYVTRRDWLTFGFRSFSEFYHRLYLDYTLTILLSKVSGLPVIIFARPLPYQSGMKWCHMHANAEAIIENFIAGRLPYKNTDSTAMANSKMILHLKTQSNVFCLHFGDIDLE